MMSPADLTHRFRRRCNEDTVQAIREAQAHAKGEIELDEGYVPPGEHLLKVDRTPGFERDLERMVREGMDVGELESAVDILANKGIPPRQYRNRPMRGHRRGTRRCQIGPDLTLFYLIENGGLTLLGIDRQRLSPTILPDGKAFLTGLHNTFVLNAFLGNNGK